MSAADVFQDPKEGGIVKIIDYGLSTFYQPGQKFHEVVGTAYYVPPEMCKCLTDKDVSGQESTGLSKGIFSSRSSLRSVIA